MNLGSESTRARTILVAVVVGVAVVTVSFALVARLTGGSDDGQDEADTSAPEADPSASDKECLQEDPDGVFGGDRFDELVDARLCVFTMPELETTTIQLSEEDLEVLRDAEAAPEGQEHPSVCAPPGTTLDLQGTTASGDSTHFYLASCSEKYRACLPSPCPPGRSGWWPDEAAAALVTRLLDQAGLQPGQPG